MKKSKKSAPRGTKAQREQAANLVALVDGQGTAKHYNAAFDRRLLSDVRTALTAIVPHSGGLLGPEAFQAVEKVYSVYMDVLPGLAVVAAKVDPAELPEVAKEYREKSEARILQARMPIHNIGIMLQVDVMNASTIHADEILACMNEKGATWNSVVKLARLKVETAAYHPDRSTVEVIVDEGKQSEQRFNVAYSAGLNSEVAAAEAIVTAKEEVAKPFRTKVIGDFRNSFVTTIPDKRRGAMSPKARKALAKRLGVTVEFVDAFIEESKQHQVA